LTQIKNFFKEMTLTTLLISYAIITILNFLVLIFQSAYYNLDTIHNLVWYSPDFPVIGLTEIPQPFGQHFFGDFLHFVTAATRDMGDTPYYPYLPASLIVGKFFSLFPYTIAVLLYFLIFFPLFLLPILLIKDRLNSSDKLLISIFLIFNIGTLYLFDRGNIQLFVSACFSVFVYFYAKRKYVPAVIFLGIAAAVKLWPILFIWPLLRLKEWRVLVWFLLTILILNAVPFLIFDTSGSSQIQYLREQFNQIISFGSIGGELWHAGGKNSSLSALFYSIIEYTPMTEPFQFMIKHFIIIQVIGLMATAVGLIGNQLLPSQKFMLLAIFLLIFPSAQYGYSASILTPVLIYHIYEKFKLVNLKKEEVTFGYEILILMLAVLPISYVLPIQQTSSQWLVDLNTFLTPTLLTISYLVILGKSMNRNRNVTLA
jgi:Glycosyltransferase family 87